MGDSDLRQAWRALARAPGVTAVIVLSLAVGIGVNAAVFSWIQALVLRPLPGVANAASVYMVEPRTEGNLRPGASWLEYLDLAPRLGALRDLAAFRMVPFNVGERTRNERTYGLLVSGNYFTALGLAAERGRLLRPEDAARPGAEPVAVVSHAFWQTRLGGAADVVGTTLRVNDRDLRVIGVTGERFQGTVLGLQFDLWVPATMAPELFPGSRELEDRGARGYFLLGRLPPATTTAQAAGEAAAAMQALAVAYPASNTGITAEVLPYWRASRGPQEMVLQALAILQGVLLLLLVAVCANAANLLLARASTRQREVGVRLAIGARPSRIVRLLLTEHLLMALLAAVLGIVIAYWGSQALRAGQMLSTAFPVRFQSGVDGWTLAFAVGLAVVCALAFGTVAGAAPGPRRAGARPAGRRRWSSGARHRPQRADGGAGGRRADGAAGRRVVPAQHAGHPRHRPGLPSRGPAAGGLRPERSQRRRRGWPRVRQPVARAAARPARSRGGGRRLVGAPGHPRAADAGLHARRPRPRPTGPPTAPAPNVVTPGYFQAMGIPLVAGRDFAAMRDQAAPRQVLVNEAFVQTFVADGEAIGRRLWNNDREYVIAGIVRTSVNDSFNEGPTPCLYFSYRDRPSIAGEMHLATRSGAEAALADDVRRLVRELDPSLPVYNVRTMVDHLDTSLFLRKVPARMFAVLGPLLLVLAAIGIYAVVAYAVSHRTIEIGVRLALGATRAGVIRQVVSDTLRVITAGAVAGWLAVYVVYIHLAPGAPVSLAVFAGVPVLLLAVGAAASWWPARRAARIDPAIALKHL